ncbi:MAG: tRNA (adenosine(37)-N6)-threonylcarbamoyltransferase complex ATPase subunit type 1 TsaE [Patescibacteria group bacterium]
MTYTTHSAEETQKVAAGFAKTLKGGEFVSLIGDLGAGKTTFTRGLVEALGGTVRVKSPTFTVMNEYPVEAGSIKRVVHIDFYRFTETAELTALALEDERRPDTVILAEWPNALDGVRWHEDVQITIEHGTDEHERSITVI